MFSILIMCYVTTYNMKLIYITHIIEYSSILYLFLFILYHSLWEFIKLYIYMFI